nr:sigma-70 family RNA polymerase sigma factor [Nocardioides sp. zg-DK7169]
MKHARFEALYRQEADGILRYLRYRVGPDAEDLVAETFSIAWQKLPHLPDPPRPWLLATARRVSANHLRARRRRRTFEVSDLDEALATTGSSADDVHRRRDLVAGLRSLPPLDREAIVRRHRLGGRRRLAVPGRRSGFAACMVRCSVGEGLRMHDRRDRRSSSLEVALGLPLLPFVWAWDLLRWVGRGVRRVVAAIAGAVARVLAALGRAVSWLFRPVTWLLKAVRDALRPVAELLARWGAAVVRAVERVLLAPWRWLTAAFRALGRLLLRPFQWIAAAWAALRRWVVAAVAPVLQALRAVCLAPLRWARAAARAVGRFFKRLFAAPVRWLRALVLTPVRRVRDAVRRARRRVVDALPRPRLRRRPSDPAEG